MLNKLECKSIKGDSYKSSIMLLRELIIIKEQILSYNTSGFKYLFPETWRRTQCYNARVNRDPNIAFCHPAEDFKEKRIPLRDIFISEYNYGKIYIQG